MRTNRYTWLTAAGMAIALSGCASEPMITPNATPLPINKTPLATAVQPNMQVETVPVPTTETLDSEMAAWQHWQARHNTHSSSTSTTSPHPTVHRPHHRVHPTPVAPPSTEHASVRPQPFHPAVVSRPQVVPHAPVVAPPRVTHPSVVHHSVAPSTPHHTTTKVRQTKPVHAPIVNKYTQRLETVFKEWKGTPYVYGGTSRRGIDCSAFVQVVYRQVYGIDLPRTTLQQVKWGHRVSRNDIQQGDLIFFHTGVNTRHVGVYFADGRFMESSSSRGVIMSELSNPYWRRHFWQVRRIV